MANRSFAVTAMAAVRELRPVPGQSERLEQLYGADCEMRFDSGESGGLSVLLRFPFHAARTAS